MRTGNWRPLKKFVIHVHSSTVTWQFACEVVYLHVAQEEEEKENGHMAATLNTIFKSDTGEVLRCGVIQLPTDITVNKLQEICNALLQQEDPLPLAFYVNNVEITDTLEKRLKDDFYSLEDIVEIVYQPQALFKVRAVTRCTGSLEGF